MANLGEYVTATPTIGGSCEGVLVKKYDDGTVLVRSLKAFHRCESDFVVIPYKSIWSDVIKTHIAKVRRIRTSGAYN
jgi:hypothetical protein